MVKLRKKRSKIWLMPKSEMQELVKSKSSIADICRSLGFCVTGTAFGMIRKRIEMDSIDISHIKLGIASNEGRRFSSNPVPLCEAMVRNSSYSRGSLKARLIKEGIISNECSICGQKPEWNGQSLTMVLDHENGVNNDHRKENLRLLCPNCNSQQKTFSGRNK